MNINILSILIIRVNLVFRVSLTLFVDSSLLDNIMNPVWKRGKRSIEKSYKEQKPEQSSDLNHNYSLFVVSKQKMKLMKGNMLQADDVLIPNIRFRKFQIDPQKFERFAAQKVFLILMRLKKNQNRMMTMMIYDQVSSLINSKLLLAKIIQVICSIFWTSSYSKESHHQMKWCKEFETCKANIMTIISYI